MLEMWFFTKFKKKKNKKETNDKDVFMKSKDYAFLHLDLNLQKGKKTILLQNKGID